MTETRDPRSPSRSPLSLRSARLHFRALAPEYAEEVAVATLRNAAYLSPWIPWAHRLPEPRETTRERLRTFRAQLDAGEEYHYGLWSRTSNEFVGGVGLHRRVGTGGLEVGYWIDARQVGAGLATEAAAVATRLGLELLGAIRVHIHVQPDNAASLRVAEKLGYVREGTLRARLEWVDGSWRDQVAHTLLASELPASAARGYDYVALDEDDDPIEIPTPEPENRS